MLSQAISLNLPRKVYRAAVGAVFFLYGLCFATWASRIPNIQQSLHLSDSALGGVLFTLPVGLMLSLPLAGFLISRFGSRKILIFGVIVYSVTLVTLGLATNVWQLVAGLLFFGLAGNLVNISVNTQAVGVEALYDKTIMASFHGLWSLAGFTGAAIGTFMMGQGVFPYKHFLLIMTVAIIVLLISSRFILQDDAKKESSQQPLFAMPDKSLLTLGLIAFCSMICEGAMFDWSGVYFKKVVHAEDGWTGAGYTAFMATMAFGRFIADWFTSKFGLKRTLQISGTLTATGLMIAVFFPNLVTAIIGFLLVGLGVSSVVPLVYSAAGKSKVMSAGVALAAVSTIGFLGFLAGPPLIGLVAGATSLKISFFIIAFMGMAVTLLAGRKISV